MRVFDVGAKEGPEVVSDRVLTIPNLLSLARLLVLPVAYLDLSSGRHVRATVLLLVFGSTDWLDGYLARRFDQVTRLGKVLDPIADRLLFVVVGVGFVVGGLLPWWPVVVLLVRDVLLLGVGALLMARGTQPPPVSRTGKAATFGLGWALWFVLLASVLGEGPRDPQPALHLIGWATLVANLILYWVAAVQYARWLRAQRSVGATAARDAHDRVG